MKLLNRTVAAAAFACAAFFATNVHAVTYSPLDPQWPVVTDVTPGYINAWWIPHFDPGPPTQNPDYPANQNPVTIEALVEILTGTNVSLVTGGAANCNQTGFSCSTSGKVGSVSVLASIFAIHLGAGEFVFQYANPINPFTLTLPDGRGMGLSNVRAFSPSVVPVPAALPLLLTGLAGAYGMARRRKRKAKVA
jgi:hypothetical protein